ncbi:glycosyltransferase family 9 protein [Pseudothauera rhizosphaerae]|uniref:Glycosyltransferase family 9 protein n=1 Tax=Pseudothauera rhizosphaerae TaxID=2565932 RepID=A0A4S4AAI9_9RHOO|nr:glycosyltransferase family 9 protein [Pseudothauera rhizosphaerae]THF55916.1 glycosyltransferase family 9 protein [Pseudothauera rhizosphaerae]
MSSQAARIKYHIVPYTRGIGIELGGKAFPHFVEAASVDDVADESQAFVVASYQGAGVESLREWWRTVLPGGHLVLHLPHLDTTGAGFIPAAVEHEMRTAAVETGFDLIVCEPQEDDFLQVFQKPAFPTGQFKQSWLTNIRSEPTACVVRYGGFGDMLQASNILPALKREGFHVTVMTTPKGQDILREDPHVDAWFIQDTDQVPNHELAAFWKVQEARFDRFVNLSESVEGTLLPIPCRANFHWPDAVRRKELGRNYLEWTSELAQVPYGSEARFYPDAAECQRVAGLMEPGKFHVVFALAGSSIHKFWPHQDALIARCLLELPDVVFHLVGDYACQLLEAGWEAEPRVHCRSGALPIRDTLTMAVQAQAVIGPETGVLNAVAFEASVAKVILLSHSSHENLTKHWVNTTVLTPPVEVGCYPCHRLHYGRDYCHEHRETGAAICQQAIDPALAFDAIRRAYERWRTD